MDRRGQSGLRPSPRFRGSPRHCSRSRCPVPRVLLLVLSARTSRPARGGRAASTALASATSAAGGGFPGTTSLRFLLHPFVWAILDTSAAACPVLRGTARTKTRSIGAACAAVACSRSRRPPWRGQAKAGRLVHRGCRDRRCLYADTYPAAAAGPPPARPARPIRSPRRSPRPARSVRRRRGPRPARPRMSAPPR